MAEPTRDQTPASYALWTLSGLADSLSSWLSSLALTLERDGSHLSVVPDDGQQSAGVASPNADNPTAASPAAPAEIQLSPEEEAAREQERTRLELLAQSEREASEAKEL